MAAINRSGLVATIGHLVIVFATTKAQANLLAPFQYLEIIGATFLGFVVFGDVPSVLTLIGITLIVTSGLYLWYRENIRYKIMMRNQNNNLIPN